MSVPLTINGVTFNYPQQFDINWGPTLTNWSTAVTNGMLQKAGGTFTLTAEVNFGATYGLLSPYYKSAESDIAETGVVRLANESEGIVWRNALDSADLALTVNASNQLTFNGVSIGATTSLTDGHILVGDALNQPADVAMSGDIAITNAGVTSIATGVIVNADVNASAAIALTKLAPTTAYYWYAANVSGVLTPLAVTASRAVATDANGLPTVTATTATELGYLNGVGGPIQTQINGLLSLTGGTMSGIINMGNNKITALGVATTGGDAIAYRQGGQAVDGSTANSSATAGTIQQGTISTPDFRANAVTLTQTSSATASASIGTTITSVSITTVGGKVLIAANAGLGGSSATILSKARGGAVLVLDRDGTKVATATGNLSMDNTANSFDFTIATSLSFIDAPAAGTYTYKISYSLGTGVSSVADYSLSVVELRA